MRHDENQQSIGNKFHPARGFFRRSAVLAASALVLSLAACHGQNEDANKQRLDARTGSASDQGTKGQGQAGNMAGAAGLSQAIKSKDLKALQSLLSQGVDVNAPDIIGRTPLHVASFYGWVKAAELLIAKDANVNAKDREGLTPLHAAVLGGNRQVAALLISKGADIHAETNPGLTPLHLAAATGQYQMAKLLLRRGADINRQDRDGKPPLFYASRNGHSETGALLQKGNGNQ